LFLFCFIIKKKYEGIEAELDFPEPTKEEIKENIKQKRINS